MDPLEGQVPVLLTWSEDEQAIEVRGDAPPGDGSWTPVLGELARFAREVLDLAPTAPVHGRLFECHPDDLAVLDGAARRFSDGRGFARAFAHDANGDFLVNARYREVTGVPVALDSAAVTRLVSEANTQAALQRIQARLEHAQAAIDAIAEHQRLTVEAEALSVVELIDEAWQTYQVNGAVSYTDWDRISAAELPLRKSYRVVLGELDRIAEALAAFSDVTAARESLMIEPTYVRDLVALEQLLLRAIAQYGQLNMAVRADREEPLAASEARLARQLTQFQQESRCVYERLKSLAPDVAKGPGVWTFLCGGLPKVIAEEETVANACANAAAVRRQIPGRPPLPPPPRLRVIEADAS